MNYREFPGKTLEDALEGACAYFNSQKDYIEYEVIKKSKSRVFNPFGQSQVVIKARPKTEEIKKPQKVLKPQKTAPQRSQEEEVILEELTKDSKEIVTILEDIIKLTGYEYRLNTEETKDDLRISIFGPSMKDLLQEDGVGIESLKHILGRISSKKGFERKRIGIDINDFKKEKEVYIRKLAVRLANKAKDTKKDVLVNPMNAYERRIFHLEVEKIGGLKTLSLGDGHRKKIKIMNG